MFHNERINRILNRVLQIIVLVYQAIALIAFLAIPFLSSRWLQTPFLGAFVEQTMLFNGVGQAEPAESWSLFLDEHLRLKYQIVQVDGVDVASESGIRAVLQDYAPGDTVDVTVRSIETGETEIIPVTLTEFPASARTSYLLIPYLVGFFFLGTSLWIFGMRRTESGGRAFALFATSVALGCAGLFDLYTTHALSFLWTFAMTCAAGALVDLALVFPQELRWAAVRPYLRWLGYLAGIVLFILAAFNLLNFQKPDAYIANFRYIYNMAGLVIIFFVGMVLYRRFTSKSPVVRQQANTVMWGMILSFGPLGGWFLATAIRPMNFQPLLVISLVFFPIITGYSILRLRVSRTDYLLRRGALYALLGVLVVAGYALVVGGLSLVFGGFFTASNPWVIGAMVFVLALVFNPLRNRLQHMIDAVFFRGERAYQQRVQEFGHAMTKTVDLASILRILRQQILNTLLPDRLHVYVYDHLNDQYAASAGEDGLPTSDIRFAPGSPLAQSLGREKLPLFLPGGILPPDLEPEGARLSLLGAQLFVPLPGGERLLGWLALGPRRSGENYASQDLTFLDLLSDQASVAVERAQVVSRMERRVREMNILARVAQGVNVTVIFDDILELIFAQTNQVMPVDDFHITLYNEQNKYYYFAFCLEKDERLTGRENIPLPPGVGLGQQVVRGRRSILAADYERECQARSVTPSSSGVYAWMGVPLNAGAETIGALTISSRDPAAAYTQSQMELLQAIADQAAGAIVKTRLLQETERRARQLATLNDITRQLTGTLELEPLLANILESAVGILNCEAGTLFLVDEQTDELVFKVVISPVAENLVGQRLAPGAGIVGEAVRTRAPVISNNVQQTSAWYASTDEKTGFSTRSILAVPLQVKERVIGVLEVMNRKDGMPFDADDQTLLAAFAGQAAVAIENARLYTLTDQALNVRVEELSVMQRIDRELNASLDVARAMRITLDWALRQSAAEAGLIGILDPKGIRIMAQKGYDALEAEFGEAPMPLEQQPVLRAAVETGQPQRADLAGGGLLPEARSQMVIPIRREADVIGLVVMESLAPEFPAEALSFMTRLSDHAAIAIANAQLYAEVQAASVAKSEFVSFVAHELKNPMTSIKGYTELLSAGAVGVINENQANFLNTIRSNVERMSTLVSDLNDNSKIEAGRLRLEFKGVDMAEAVDEAVKSTKRQLDDKKQTVTVSLPDDLPKIWADRTRLAQILINLVSNANKYTPEGGQVTISAERAANQWDPDGAADVAHIWVKDTGIGISLEDQKKIFQKFFRSDDQKAREASGTGLGLNITKSLVEMMGGRIWFESEFRQGTAFHFTVPVAQG
ncbi:MAG: putative two-component sensor histidine kinase [Anaerolineaceae bacterium]|nr:MAG: putative two-component sensor histidine kinase [Anaerolineaceae bacterium]